MINVYRIFTLLFFFVIGFGAGNVVGYDIALHSIGYVAEKALEMCVKQAGGSIEHNGVKVYDHSKR